MLHLPLRRALFPMSLLVLVALAVLGGCSGDAGFLPGANERPLDERTVASGAIVPAGADFDLVLDEGGTPEIPVAGPFLIRGRNLRIDPASGALAVDLSVVNNTLAGLPEPVGLTFTRLLPDSVLVLNADNGVSGAGAAIVLAFANDDLVWSPGEESLPRTVLFSLPPGGAVGFHARLNVGGGPLTGRIEGLVWLDADADGLRGADEGPVGGIRVVATTEPGPWADPDGPLPPLVERQTFSGPDGRYLLADLPAGFYGVTARPLAPGMVTTEQPFYVMLSDSAGRVGSFDGADFGVNLPPVTSMVILPEADTTVRADVDSRMNDNYGCDPVVTVGRGRAGEPDRIRGLMRFDLPIDGLPLLPIRATLEATLNIFRDGTGQTYHLSVHRIVAGDSLEHWIEGDGSDHTGVGCAWVDEAEGVAWIGAGDGGDENNQTQPHFDPEPIAVIEVVQNATPVHTRLEWDITPLVEAWLLGEPNYGLVIRDADAVAPFRSIWLSSREGEAFGYGDQPCLRIEFPDLPVGAR